MFALNMTGDFKFMERAIELARDGMRTNKGGPFGAVVVKDGLIIGEGCNNVLHANDPTAHAEITAIRMASAALNNFDLSGCEIYTSCEPCPMCLSAIYWARIDVIYFGCTHRDAASIGFDDAFLYDELKADSQHRKIKINQMMHIEALQNFNEWMNKPDKTGY